MCGKGWSACPSASIASISFCLDFGTFHCPYPELGKASFRPCRPLAPELPGMGSLLVAGSWVACSQPCLGPSPVPTPPPRETRQQWGPEGCSPRPPDTCWAVGKQSGRGALRTGPAQGGMGKQGQGPQATRGGSRGDRGHRPPPSPPCLCSFPHFDFPRIKDAAQMVPVAAALPSPPPSPHLPPPPEERPPSRLP